MYKVLIVDDEKEIRDGLAECSWETMGLRMEGSCSHGLEALQFLAEHPVDIVMTDIRMPFMDGIELMEVLRRQYPFVHVIILSGHSDFEYAQQAIRNGAADYLLKPLRFDVFHQTVERLIKVLDERKQAEYRSAVLARKAELLTKVLRQEFLSRLLDTAMSEEDIEQAGSEGEVLFDGDSFTAAMFRLDRLTLQKQPISEQALKLQTFSLDNILHDIWQTKQLGYHFVNKRTAEFYLLSQNPAPAEHFTAILPQLAKYAGLFKSTFSVGIGHTVRKPCDIYLSAHTARVALQSNLEESSVSFYDQDDLLPGETASGPAIRDALLQDNSETGRDSIILVNAKQYIQDHYHRSITLKEVAEHVYVSPGHLCALFKEAGDTYLKYLTSVRIKKAVELLKDSSIKVYEIVERVGYTDPAYFSEVFKRVTGKTPNEYRGKSKHYGRTHV